MIVIAGEWNEDLQLETNLQLQAIRKFDAMNTKLDLLLEMIGNTTMNQHVSSPTWDYHSSPTFTTRSEGIPPWNQSQYKYCQPLFDSWRDMRQEMKTGSLRVFKGGLGGLLVEGEYEVWVCAHKDPCALGGDFFFCYVFQEKTHEFVPWDQHYNLHLFQSSNPGTN